MANISDISQFEWDSGNRGKNYKKHKVTDQECEESFFDQHKRILKDVFHSLAEERYILLGQTRTGRRLFVVFTIRQAKIRVISARDLSIKERNLYE